MANNWEKLQSGQQFIAFLQSDLPFPKLWQFGCQFVQVTVVDIGLCQDFAIPGTGREMTD